MKNVLVFVGDYYPTPSPNTNCISEVLEEFNSWNITIVSTCYSKKNEGVQIAGNKRIIRVYDKQNAWLNSKDSYLPQSIAKHIKHAVDYIRSKVEFPDKKIYLRKQVKSVLKKYGETNYDAIISVSLPFSCNLLAEAYKEIDVNAKWFVYLLDPFSNNFNVQKQNAIYRKRAYEVEKRIYMKCDYIISMPEIKIEKEYKEKVLRAGIPLLRNNCEKTETGKYGVFSGGLLKGIREPEPVLDIFQKYFDEQDTDYHLKLYTKIGGYYENVLMKYEADSSGKIRCEGFIPREELSEILKKASFLVNIGNTVFEQTPSKIFEYMSYGKPIIHFYSDEKDTSIPYLNCYPNVIMINVNDPLNKNVFKISSFLEGELQVVRFKDLIKSEKLLKCTPQYTAEIIKERID